MIIISTVRSNQEYLSEDKIHNLGFIANEKRFNVAVTRAQALLIIVGNSRILKTDPNWNSLLEFCKENDAYI